MRDRLKSLTIGSDKSWSQFSSSLEPIKESQASPIISSEQAASSLAEAIVRDADSSISQEPSEQGRSQLLQYSPLPALPESLPSSPIAESDPADASDVLFATADAQADDAAPPDAPTVPTVVAAAEATPQPIATSKQSKRKSTLYIENRPTLIRSRSCESLQYSDEGSTGTLSDLSSSSQMSDSVDSDDSSFYESLADSDIDGDENLADDDSDARTSNPATGRLSEEEEGKNGYFAEGDVLQGTFGNAVGRQAAGIVAEDANGGEHRHSVTRSTSTASRTAWAHLKKKTWIKGAPIASGSFGSVYFGMNTRTGVIMAVKEVELPKPGTVSMNRNQKMADALRHELDLLKGLDHKNVVKYLGTDMDDRNLFIFLEYVSGGSVSSALASFGMFPESLVRTYTGQILEGLVYLHDQGIIHRDIKGGNVLIDQDGSVKISDFGISKRVDEVVASSKKDRRASLQGSVFWMAPEVVKDTKYTIKGDVWSLGCLVIEMITGAHPFPELDQMQALFSIGQRGRPKIPDGMSVAGQQFLDEALQVDLEKRPTAKDLVPHPFVYDTEPPSP
ncbi:ATP binding [Kickxella alabastrina]|uniref:ATP binding n=1 Tax=Kickxella alabastrina TaxID=61397 RepID=A0ACC1IDK2_9FUNG|nr:ATP binding [Kickxella alabastrina]